MSKIECQKNSNMLRTRRGNLIIASSKYYLSETHKSLIVVNQGNHGEVPADRVGSNMEIEYFRTQISITNFNSVEL